MHVRRLFVPAFCLSAVLTGRVWAHSPAEHSTKDHFQYDHADRISRALMLESKDYYSPGICTVDGTLWVTWLEFVPGKGDILWVGAKAEEGWSVRKPVDQAPGTYANPTLTCGRDGTLWLTYEAEQDAGGWDVFARRRRPDGTYTVAQRLSPSPAGDIAHRAAADLHGGIRVIWQTDRDGQFDIMTRRVTPQGMDEVERLSENSRGDWDPAVAVAPDGTGWAVWDSYDGTSYNVVGRHRAADGWGLLRRLVDTPAFEGRAQVACDRRGQTWLLWEEAGENWGGPYRARPGPWDNISDDRGPLHRFRLLHVARLEPDGTVRMLADPLPLPSIVAARQREHRWPGAADVGAYYERGQLAVDASDRAWVVYRHFYRPQLGSESPVRHHIEHGWQLFARCLDGKSWSPLNAFDVHIRDGLQRVSVTALGHGLAVVWATGRTDRRTDTQPRGTALAVVDPGPGEPSAPVLATASETLRPPAAGAASATARPKLADATVGGRRYEVVFGDLHRHTDLSLCFPFFDGAIDDAYRYAIDVAPLDFLGITDHTRDINHGNALSQLWWRCRKEVTRHRLGNRFIPYFAYERSHRDTDHNVISLRPDMLRDFPPPLTDFWKEIGHDTFTIPHAPINSARCWAFHDDAKRPLLEIYQGCRDYDSQGPANAGLAKGYHLGFIASSDHMSTSASYACVWTPRRDRETIFRSMQARRTYGATDHIRLVFRCGDHWMGEQFAAEAVPEFQIEIDGTAPLSKLAVIMDGIPVRNVELAPGKASFRGVYNPGPRFTGAHYFYLHLVQEDGNQAWSSPLWVRYDNPDVPPPKDYSELLRHAKNLAAGRPVSVSFAADITHGTPEVVTDGAFDDWVGHGPSKESHWAQVDLGEVTELGFLRVWHYYRDSRTYSGNRLAVSATGEFAGEETVVFDGNVEPPYPEPAGGRLFAFPPVKARYIRNWLTINTSNPSQQWIEIQAFAPADK